MRTLVVAGLALVLGGAAGTQPAGVATRPGGASGRAEGAMPQAEFFGVQASGARVVYIVDHSGSMLDHFDAVQKELAASVEKLVPAQSFGVVLVSEKAEALTGPQLVRATPENRKKVEGAIPGIKAMGQNDDAVAPFQRAFEIAFALKPQAVIFLTDGRFGKAVPGVVAKLNADHSVKVHTIAFVSEGAEYRGALEKMAKENGGTFRFVGEKEVEGKK